MSKKGLSLIVLLLIPAIFAFAGETFIVFFTGNYLIPSDSSYKDIYGNGVVYPELIIGSEVRKNFSLWVGFGHLSAKGTTLAPEDKLKSSQNYLSFGTRYSGKISRNMIYKIDVGLFYLVYKQDDLETELRGSDVGFRTDLGFVYTFSKNLFIEFSLGYLSASDRVKDVRKEWGGFKGGVGIGIWF